MSIKIFILNNECYGIIKQFQDAYFESRYTATVPGDYSSPDFAKVAASYGMKSSKITIESNISDEFYLNLRNIYKNFKIIKTFDSEAVVMMGDTAKGILIRGVDKNRINELDIFKNKIIDGKISDFKSNTIVIGKQLAIELGVVVGDKLNIMSSTSASTILGMVPKQSTFEIIAVFNSGLYEYDRNIGFFNIEDSLSFFGKTVRSDTYIPIEGQHTTSEPR